jgi:hypothetical protein
MSAASEWIESGGGPLLFAPERSLSSWHGNDATPAGVSDYARACNIKDEIATLLVGDAQVLVLGDEPDRTALIETQPATALLVRWRWADSEASLMTALGSVGLDALPFRVVGTFQAILGWYHLFDSAYSGTSAPRTLKTSLKGGTYSYESTEFRPNDRTCALLHRIRPMPPI